MISQLRFQTVMLMCKQHKRDNTSFLGQQVLSFLTLLYYSGREARLALSCILAFDWHLYSENHHIYSILDTVLWVVFYAFLSFLKAEEFGLQPRYVKRSVPEPAE